MRPPPVVVIDPSRQSNARVRTGFEGVEINAFVFQTAPQTFDAHFIHPAAPAIHRDPNPGCGEHGREPGRGELALLIRVEYLRPAEPRHGLLQGFKSEFHIHGVRDPPGQDFAGCPVQDRDQVEKAAPHRDVGDIGAPDLNRDSRLGQRIDHSLPVKGLDACMDGLIERGDVGEGLIGKVMRLEVVPDDLDIINTNGPKFRPLYIPCR